MNRDKKMVKAYKIQPKKLVRQEKKQPKEKAVMPKKPSQYSTQPTTTGKKDPMMTKAEDIDKRKKEAMERVIYGPKKKAKS